MKNYQYYEHANQNSTVVGFRVSDLELKKLRDTKDTLVKLGIKGTTSDTLRVILNSFNLESWKQQTQQSIVKTEVYPKSRTVFLMS